MVDSERELRPALPSLQAGPDHRDRDSGQAEALALPNTTLTRPVTGSGRSPPGSVRESGASGSRAKLGRGQLAGNAGQYGAEASAEHDGTDAAPVKPAQRPGLLCSRFAPGPFGFAPKVRPAGFHPPERDEKRVRPAGDDGVRAIAAMIRDVTSGVSLDSARCSARIVSERSHRGPRRESVVTQRVSEAATKKPAATHRRMVTAPGSSSEMAISSSGTLTKQLLPLRSKAVSGEGAGST